VGSPGVLRRILIRAEKGCYAQPKEGRSSSAARVRDGDWAHKPYSASVCSSIGPAIRRDSLSLKSGSQAPQVSLLAFSSQNVPKAVQVMTSPSSTNVCSDPLRNFGSELVSTMAVAIDLRFAVTT